MGCLYERLINVSDDHVYGLDPTSTEGFENAHTLKRGGRVSRSYTEEHALALLRSFNAVSAIMSLLPDRHESHNQ